MRSRNATKVLSSIIAHYAYIGWIKFKMSCCLTRLPVGEKKLDEIDHFPSTEPSAHGIFLLCMLPLLAPSSLLYNYDRINCVT
mmetsp:Transcript_13715/g.20957  ORF Transcript_13715/g.20957 Transcript_13715/m.20957 type:complete len:83 (-) Transcript_13715:137-385(-)